MDHIIAQLPKSVLALLVLVLGYGLIIWNDPPKSACDEQLLSFRRSQREFLYGRPTSGDDVLPPIIKRLYETCEGDNSPGGCFEYFERLRKFSADMNELPRQCAPTVAEDAQIQRWLFRSMKLMTQIAWGDRGPASINRKYSWFDSSELSLFCALRKNAIANFGQETFEEWAQGAVADLPGTEGIVHDLVFQKSLVSLSCASYR